MIDPHYTPADLANRLIKRIKKDKVSSIADFCVGEGNLLKAANIKWQNSTFYGNDISSQVLRTLKREYPDWVLGNCDFLNLKSRNKSIIFKRKYDIILLNPPFTCKGSTVQSVNIEERVYHMSIAMAYLVEAIKYLKKDGVLYAILPQSIAYSQKDEKIRIYLKEKYHLKIFEELNNQCFEKCSPNIVLVAVNDKKLVCVNKSLRRIDIKIENLMIKRGSISMHTVDKDRKYGIPLVHSTNIINEKIAGIKYKIIKSKSIIEGPALLIHRVGQPNKKKVCVIMKKEKYALSDCVIGIKTDKLFLCQQLKERIINNWSDFSNLYKGTGAKYITINRLKYFLNLHEKNRKINK
jgi:tRNA1(Val) A37 N6-methylase TrmN6